VRVRTCVAVTSLTRTLIRRFAPPSPEGRSKQSQQGAMPFGDYVLLDSKQHPSQSITWARNGVAFVSIQMDHFRFGSPRESRDDFSGRLQSQIDLSPALTYARVSRVGFDTGCSRLVASIPSYKESPLVLFEFQVPRCYWPKEKRAQVLVLRFIEQGLKSERSAFNICDPGTWSVVPLVLNIDLFWWTKSRHWQQALNAP